MNTYQIKISERKAKYAELADKARTESNARYAKARQIGDMIPFGQPILVGHHSERSHRGAIDSINNNMRKSIQADEKAAHYERKAENYGENIISADDPEAITKLEEKLAKAESEHQALKNHNLKSRKTGEEKIPQYALTNSLGRIRSIRQRIVRLKKTVSTEVQEVLGDGWSMHEDKDDNRIHFTFSTVPNEELRSVLKRQAFKWSLTRSAWVRQITNNARRSARQVIAELNK